MRTRPYSDVTNLAPRGWGPRKRDLGSSGGGAADAAVTSNMAHAGGGGSAGRGFGGSRWGRSGSGGHEKLPVHVSDAPSLLLGTRSPAGRRPSVRPRLGLLSAQSGPGDPTSLPWNPSAAPRFPPIASLLAAPRPSRRCRGPPRHPPVIPAAPVIPGTPRCAPEPPSPTRWPLVILAAPRFPGDVAASPRPFGPPRRSSV